MLHIKITVEKIVFAMIYETYMSDMKILYSTKNKHLRIHLETYVDR